MRALSTIACDIDIVGVILHEQKVIPNPIYQQIGAIIRIRRKALGMTQQVLADRLGISRGSLANIEIGRQTILIHQLYRLAEALNLPREDLLPEPRPSGVQRPNVLALPLPDGLKDQQREQLAQLIEGVTTATKQRR